MKHLALSVLLIGSALSAPLFAQTMPGNPPPSESQPDPTMPMPGDEDGPMTPGEGDATDMPAPRSAMPPSNRTTPPQSAPMPNAMGQSQRTLSDRTATPVPGPTQARSGPMTAPTGATMMNPPMCSRTVRDNCMDPRQAPRGYRPG